MISVMRLAVCGGLFAFGYYLGRQSCRLESLQGPPDAFENPDFSPEPDKADPEQQDPVR